MPSQLFVCSLFFTFLGNAGSLVGMDVCPDFPPAEGGQMSDLLPGGCRIYRHEGEAASIWRSIQRAAFPLMSAKCCRPYLRSLTLVLGISIELARNRGDDETNIGGRFAKQWVNMR